MQKTNVIRILEFHKVPFEIKDYKCSEDEIDAVSVAKKIGAEPETVFKTLVARNEKNAFFVFIIPGNYELDFKKAAKQSQNKKIEMIKVKEIFPLTGYIRGGCSPIGMKKQYPTLVDESAQLYEFIYVSAGVRGKQIKIAPDNLLTLVNASYCDLI